MRIIIFLILSVFLFAQPTSIKADSNTTDTPKLPTEIPEQVKPLVKEIVVNIEENRAASSEIDKERKKQTDLMQEIRIRISQLKSQANNSKKIVTVNKKIAAIEAINDNKAIKPSVPILEFKGQVVQYESKSRTFVGRLLHKSDSIYYPYIMDAGGKQVFLKY